MGNRPDTTTPNKSASEIRRLGKYEIVKRLGQGGMGTVYLANDTELKRTVALKILSRERAENETLVRRFKAEAQAAAQLRHKNIVAVYEAGEIDGQLYIALEYVDGTDVLSLIQKRGVLPPKRSVKVVRQVATALQHAFERKIVHRDIKPSNMLIQPNGVVKLADLGLARSLDETLDTSITRDGTTVGTIDYMAPEQARNSKATDVRSDIYALGCSWYHMLTAQPPFPDGDVSNKIQAHFNTAVPNPRDLNPGVPEAYVAVMQKMMAKDPKDRYQTPLELVHDLDQVVNATGAVAAELLSDLPEGDSPSSELKNADEQISQINEKWKGRGKPPRTQSQRSKRTKKSSAKDSPADGAEALSKKLPARELKKRQRAGGPSFVIDIDYLRIGFAAAIVLAVVGLGWWAMSRFSGEGPPVSNSSNSLSQSDELPPELEQVSQDNGSDPSGATNTPRFDIRETLPSITRGDPPFPGTDDLPGQDSAAVRELVPDWVYALRDLDSDLKTRLVVDTTSGARRGSRSIAEAVQASGGRSAVIQLKGPGPFPLEPFSLRRGQRIALRSGSGLRPVVQVSVPAKSDGRIAHLIVGQGLLDCEGLDFLITSTTSAKADSGTLAHLTTGMLALHDCTVTVTDNVERYTLCQAQPKHDDGTAPRILLEKTIVRGPRLTVVQCRAPEIDIVVGGSILATQAGPLVNVELTRGRGPSQASENTPQTENTGAQTEPAANDDQTSPPPAEQRDSQVRVLASLLASGDEVFQLTRHRSEGNEALQLRLRRSICAATEEKATLLNLTDWPARATVLSGQPRVEWLSWLQDRTQLRGFSALVHLDRPQQPVTVQDEAGWQAFWGKPVETQSLCMDPCLAVENFTFLTSEELLSDCQALIPPELASGTDIGPARSMLPPLPNDLIEERLILAAQPHLPPKMDTLSAPTEIKQFDLKRTGDKLNDILNGSTVPDGARVQLLGAGLRTLPRLHLKNKSLQLEFVTAPGAKVPLFVKPARPSPGSPAAAAITVEGGHIDLIGANIHQANSSGPSGSDVLVAIKNADFSIRNCSFYGNLNATADNEDPLITWEWSSGNRKYGLIRDSFLLGGQTLLKGETDQGLFVLDNNVLASHTLALHLRFPHSIHQDPTWIEIHRCTFRAGQSAIKIDGLPSQAISYRGHLILSENVFSPAPGSAERKPTVLMHPARMRPDNLVWWWETRNAYDPAFASYRSTGASPRQANFEIDWVGFWGTNRVDRPITGPSSVLFATIVPSLQNIDPQNSELLRECAAAHWAEDGGPVGAKVDRLGPQGNRLSSGKVDPSGKPRVPKAPSTPGKKPASNQPDF